MEQEEPPKKPEFIYIDHEVEDFGESGQREREKVYQEFARLKEARYPFFLRIITLISSFIVWLFTLIPLLLSLFLFALCVITFFQWEASLAQLKKSWALFRRGFVMGLSLLLATFLPPLGFGLILLYFLLLEDPDQGDRLSAFVYSRFRKK